MLWAGVIELDEALPAAGATGQGFIAETALELVVFIRFARPDDFSDVNRLGSLWREVVGVAEPQDKNHKRHCAEDERDNTHRTKGGYAIR